MEYREIIKRNGYRPIVDFILNTNDISYMSPEQAAAMRSLFEEEDYIKLEKNIDSFVSERHRRFIEQQNKAK